MLEAAKQIRLIYLNPELPSALLFETNLGDLIAALLSEQYDKLWQPVQIEVCWTLANVLRGSFEVVDFFLTKLNIVPSIVRLFQVQNHVLFENLLYCIGNICQESFECREKLLSESGVVIVSRIIHEFSLKLQITELLVLLWVIEALVKPPYSQKQVTFGVFIPYIGQLLYMNDETQSSTDIKLSTLNILGYLTESNQLNSSTLIELLYYQKLIKMLRTDHEDVVYAALRVIGNISAGDDSYTELMIKSALLDSVQHLFASSQQHVRM